MTNPHRWEQHIEAHDLRGHRRYRPAAPRAGPTIKAIGFSFAAGVFLDAFVVRLTLVLTVMAIAGSRLRYQPQWFARHIPHPDIEGQRLDRELAEAELAPAGTSARQG